MSCCNNDNAYSNVCRQDIPYPQVSSESVPSLIDNLVYALYGTINKSVVSGRVVWDIPCDPNNTTQVFGIPRLPGEGLLCYLIRCFDDFNEKYLGSLASAPLGPQQEGALYWNSTSNEMFVWNGTAWQTIIPNQFTQFTPFASNGATQSYRLVDRFYKTPLTVYIAPRTDGIAGDGTITNPYDAGGATQIEAAVKYDNIIKNRTKCPDFCTIRLLAGNYFTRGSNEYQPGRPNSQFNKSYRTDYPLNCSVIGDGTGSTILKQIALPENMAGTGYKLVLINIFNEIPTSPNNSFQFYTSPCVISDLTLDGNWQNLRQAQFAVNGAWIWGGRQATIRNVWLKNIGGDAGGGYESFGLSAFAYDGMSTIENCIVTDEVDSWNGDDPYVSDITAGGFTYSIPLTPPMRYTNAATKGSGVVRDCTVIAGTTLNPRTGAGAISAFGDKYAEVSNCAIYNKESGYYRDTGVNALNVIRGNTYYNCQFGVHGNFSSTDGNFAYNHDNSWIIENNTFYLPNSLEYYGPIRITCAESVAFEKNTIRCINPNVSHSGSSSKIHSCGSTIWKDNIREREDAGNIEIIGAWGFFDRNEDKNRQNLTFNSYFPQRWDQNGTGTNPGLITITRNGNIATATLVNPTQTSLPTYLNNPIFNYTPIFRISGANQSEYNGVKNITVIPPVPADGTNQSTQFTFEVTGNPAPATGTIVWSQCSNGIKDITIKGTHPDPLENGKMLRDAMLYATQIQDFDGKNNFAMNIYLESGYYKLADATNTYFSGKFNVIGNGRPEDTVIDFGTQIVQPSYAYGLASYGTGSLNAFSFKNCTITGSKSAAIGIGVVSSLMEISRNSLANVFENVIFDKGTHDIITRTLYGTFKNCTFNGMVNTPGGAINQSPVAGKFSNCTFNCPAFSGLQQSADYVNEFDNCTITLVEGGSYNYPMWIEGKIKNCLFKDNRTYSGNSICIVSEFYYTSIKNTTLDNMRLKISVGSNLAANPALRAEVFDTQIIVPTGTTPALFSQNASTNIRVANLTTNGASPYKDTNTVVQTLTAIS